MTERTTEETLPASIYRREEARKKGLLPVSRDLSTSLILLAFIGLLAILGPLIFQVILSQVRNSLSNIDQASFPAVQLAPCAMALIALIKIFQPWIMLISVIFLVAVFATLIQRGFTLSFRSAPLGPQVWFGQITSTRTLLDIVFTLLKLCGLVVVFLATIWSMRFSIIKISSLNPEQIATEFAKIIFFTGLNLSLFLLAWGIVDYIVRRIQFERALSMTPQEFKDERRAFEGDPELKKYLRRKRQEVKK